MLVSYQKTYEARLWALGIKWRVMAALGRPTPQEQHTAGRDRQMLTLALSISAIQMALLSIHGWLLALTLSVPQSPWGVAAATLALVPMLYISSHLARAWACDKMDRIHPQRHELWIREHRDLLEAHEERRILARSAPLREKTSWPAREKTRSRGQRL